MKALQLTTASLTAGLAALRRAYDSRSFSGLGSSCRISSSGRRPSPHERRGACPLGGGCHRVEGWPAGTTFHLGQQDAFGGRLFRPEEGCGRVCSYAQ